MATITYKYFQKQNDTLKEHTPADLVGHLEDIDFNLGTLTFKLGQNKSRKTIQEMVEAICRQAGCVSNPSALEGWKGFRATEDVKRKICIKMQGLNTIACIRGDNFNYEYPLGDMLTKLKVWGSSKEVTIKKGLTCELQALSRFMQDKGIGALTTLEEKGLYEKFAGRSSV